MPSEGRATYSSPLLVARGREGIESERALDGDSGVCERSGSPSSLCFGLAEAEVMKLFFAIYRLAIVRLELNDHRYCRPAESVDGGEQGVANRGGRLSVAIRYVLRLSRRLAGKLERGQGVLILRLSKRGPR